MTAIIDRRSFIAALLALAASPALAEAGGEATRRLRRIAEEMLARAPEEATVQGLDRAPRAGLARRLNDMSAEGLAADLALWRRAERLLAGLDAGRLQGAERLHLLAARFGLETAIRGATFGYGTPTPAGLMPYVVTHQSGHWATTGDFLENYHRLERQADVDAWLARLDALARTLDDETDRMLDDAARGVVPPAFILAKAGAQQRDMLAVKPADWGLVTALGRRAEAAGLKPRLRIAERLVERRILPALMRQNEALEALPRSDEAGVWKLPLGDALYAHQLRAQSTGLSALEIHRTGLEQARALEAEMDAILKRQGLTQGTVGERMAALTADPRQQQPDSEAGRAAVLALAERHVAGARALLPRISKLQLKADVRVQRVPPAIEAGQPLAYMQFASADGTRPAIYYINLQRMDAWPNFAIASLTMHEALPGHAWQGAYLAENPAAASPLAQLITFNAFIEGWALYAEQLVDELGYYEGRPLDRLGYLQAQHFRAMRLVVDTGLHHLKWSRARAIDVLASSTGRARAAATSEVDRYCCWPGQALGYKLGHNAILAERARAAAALGPAFDVRDFNDALVRSGGIPLTLLPEVVDGLLAAAKTS